MSSRFGRRAVTHVPLPWCIAPPIPPGIRTGLYPSQLRVQAIFNANQSGGPPATVSFYFPTFNLNPSGYGQHNATTGNYQCTLSLQYNAAGTILTAAASIYILPLMLAALQATPATLARRNPLEQTWSQWAGTIPADQTGRIKAWE